MLHWRTVFSTWNYRTSSLRTSQATVSQRLLDEEIRDSAMTPSVLSAPFGLKSDTPCAVRDAQRVRMIKRQQGTTMADGTDQLIQAVGIHRQNARDYLTQLAIDPRDVPSRRRLEQERSEIARLKQAIRAA